MGESGSGTVGSIQIRERIGSSGLFLAEQLGLKRRVAVRKLRRDLLANASLVARLEHEARLAARVTHPNIVAVFDFFSQRGDQYLVMEHIDGPSLRAVLNRVERIPVRLTALLLLQVVHGVAALHAQGIVHSDLSPKNILLSRWGDVKLCGLGAAREAARGAAREATGEHQPEAEPTAYSPPDRGTPQQSGDVYAVGAILAEMLTGSPGIDALQLLRGRRGLPRSRHPGLTRLIRRCLDPQPQRRPSISKLRRRLSRSARNASSDEARAEIAAWLWEGSHGDGEGALESEGSSSPAKPERQRALLVATASALVLGGVTLLTLGVWPRAEPRPSVDAGVVVEQSSGLFSDLDTVVQSQSAAVRFAIYPWAEVSVGGETPFLTPRARPLRLAPGRHVFALRHPRYGESLHTLDLEPGEERVVRHVFPAAGLP